MDDKESRLPKWAQQELENLRRNLADAKANIVQLTTGRDLPRTNFHTNIDLGNSAWRPSFHSRVRCYVGSGDRDWIELYHDSLRDGRNPALMLYGERQLSILPVVSNTARVVLSDR